MKNYQKRLKWRDQVKRMDEDRSPRKIIEYTPMGNRTKGWPRKGTGYSIQTDHPRKPQTGH